MANDQLQCALSANRDVPDCKPGPFQDCSDIIHIAVFFDGTGNNKDEDGAEKKWSNVARLYESAILDPKKGIYAIYISGVGTPYNGNAVKWHEKATSWIQDNDFTDMGFGLGGDRRLDLGNDTVNDRLRDALIANAKKLGGTVSQYASASSTKSFAEVKSTLDKHRLIKVINLSIFGFSRGVAMARAFSNRIIKSCEQKGGELIYQGYPLRLNFMGVFDTVASFGIPSENARLPWQERDLIVSPMVERCVHYVAGHEVRFAFPVDLIRKNGQLAGNWEEKTYPGVHSDVGGGYSPKDLGLPDSQGLENNYARIPMRDMMREAVISGVRITSYEEFRKVNFPLFQKLLECKPETEAAYKNYMAGCGPVSGSIEAQMKQHMKMLYSAYGTMHRTGMETPGDRSRQEAKYKYIGPKGMAWEIGKYRLAAKAGKMVRISSAINGYAQYVKPYDWQINAWDTKASSGVVDFVCQFVHDSKVDFVLNAEPFSYFKPREVTESTISIWQEGGNWIGGKAHAVGDAAESGYNTAKTKAGEAADATTQAAHDAADAAKRKAQEAATYAQRKAQEAEELANKAYDATAKAASDAADLAKRKAQEAADAANQAYNTAAKAASDAADTAKQKAKEMADAAGQTINEAEDGAQRIYEKGKYWVQSTATDAMDKSDKLIDKTKKSIGF